MRIQRLDLLRYGRFTDTQLSLSARVPDMHILFGPNEAGKSTALSAVEDLLFGIPANSRYNFKHDYPAMRVGAVLESGGKTLEIRRRKGNKDTLLNADDVPATGGAGALATFLGGADQAFFTRMFSLDHERLRKGGREILESKDEVGQMLFSAGAGLSGLRDRLRTLTEEADSLWDKRYAKHRKYYQAHDRLDAAEKALREHTVTTSKWLEVKRAYDDVQEVYSGLEKQNEEISREQRKLSRIRRVYRDIRKIATLDGEIEALGEVRPLPQDARKSLDAAERDQLGAKTRVETLNEQLEAEQKLRDSLTYDEKLLLREDDIQEFHKRRIEVQRGKLDLPRRIAELAVQEENLRRLAGELDWSGEEVDKLIERIPERPKVNVLRALLGSRGVRVSGVTNAEAAVDELKDGIANLQGEIDLMGAPIDVSKLAAVLKATRECGDTASLIRAAETACRDAKVAIERGLKSLKPPIADEQSLASAPVPTRDAVLAHREDRRNTDQQMEACRGRNRTAGLELERHRKAHERLAHDEDAVAPKHLGDARAVRDSGWSLIKRRYVEGVSVPDDEIQAFTGAGADLTSKYEISVTTADALADRRFDNAQAAAQIALTTRQIAEQEELLEVLHKEEGQIAEQSRGLESAWKRMWTEAAFEPLGPDLMLEWLASRLQILEAIGRRSAAESQLEALRAEDSKAATRILAELEAVTGEPSTLEGQPLRAVIEFATAFQTKCENEATQRRNSEVRLRGMKGDFGRKTTALEKALEALRVWWTEWAAAIELIGLAADTQPEAANAQLDAIDRMREITGTIHQIRHERIEKIERDIEVFAKDVAALVGVVATDLTTSDPEDAILELESRLETSKRAREQQKTKDVRISELKTKIEGSNASVREASETIQRLQEAADANDIDQLKAAIGNSDKLRGLKDERAKLVDALANQGDGLTLAELSAECEGVNIDDVGAHEETLGQNLKNLRERFAKAAGDRAQKRSEFDAIGGVDRAAGAAAARQAALAELREVAEQYVRVRSAATMLQWAVERYRREKQAPLLKRAGQVFAKLTGESFSDLRVEFDANDNAQLAGLRPDGKSVGVGGMSSGTADQLYLALRVASVEDYLDRADALPFVSDDLFINFDDARAAAGFDVLGELGRKTQILFFTHHQHLVDIAKQTLGESVNVISL
jgi:uncharacterized protein YhaN